MKALITAAAILAAGPAFAECGGTDHMRSQLANKYGEGIAAVGQQHDGIIIELWRSAEHGNWTILQTDQSRGLSCIVHFGQGMSLATDLGAPA